MQKPQKPINEMERLEELYSYEVLDTAREAIFDEITESISSLLEMPISLISLIDSNRQWFKSCVGLGVKETTRDISFCAHAILDDELLIVEDTLKDERFSQNPFVLDDPQIRFYAGQPLISANGFKLGTLCLVDTKPRELSKEHREILKSYARQVVALLELKKSQSKLSFVQANSELLLNTMVEGVVIENSRGEIIDFNPAALEILDLTEDQLRGRTSFDPNWKTIKDNGSPFPPEEHPAVISLQTGESFHKIIMGIRTESKGTRWININSRVFEKSGERHVIVTFQDVTQEKVRQKSQEFILNNITEGYWDLDIQNNYEYYSPRVWEMLGEDPDHKSNHPDEMKNLLNKKDLLTALKKYVDHVKSKGEEPFSFIFKHTKRDGSNVWIRSEGKVVEWDGARPIRMVGTHLDVTQEILDGLETKAYKDGLDRYAIIARTNKKGVITEVNDNFCERSGYSREELIGQTHKIVNSGYHEKGFFKQIWDQITSGKQWRGEIKNRAKNGSYYWVDTTITPVFDFDGNISEFLAFRYDITTRKERENRDRFISEIRKSYIKNLEDPQKFFEYILEKTLSITESEFGFVGKYPYDAPDSGVLKVFVHSNVTNNQNTISFFEKYKSQELEFTSFDNLSGEVIKKKEVIITNDPLSHPASIGTPSGHPPLHAFLGVPIFLNGDVIGMVGIANKENGYSDKNYEFLKPFFDAISETVASFILQKRIYKKDQELIDQARITEIQNKILLISTAEDTLEDKLKRSLRVILDIEWLSIKNQGGIFLKDPNQEILNLTVSDNLAEPLLKLCDQVVFGKCLCGKSAQLQQTVFASCIDEQHEILFDDIKPHGHYSVPMFYGNKLQGVMVLYLEDGHKKNQKEIDALENIAKSIGNLIHTSQVSSELENQKKLTFHNAKLASLGQLAAGVGHEINNPLAVVKGHASFIKKFIEKGDVKPEKYLESVLKIEASVARISSIVKGLKTFSRIDAGEFVLFNISDMLIESVELVKEIYEKEQIKLQVDVEDDLVVSGAQGRLEQVIVNLMANAKDAIKESDVKIIRLIAKRVDNEIKVWVQDTGSGVPEKIKEKIFDPFFTSKGVNEGTGIGLALSHQILVEHAGNLELERTASTGSSFMLTLKGYEKSELNRNLIKPSILNEHLNSKSHFRLKILIADDEAEIRDILKYNLEDFGHEVITTNDGQEAWEYFQTHHQEIDLVITDMQMPNMNGPELLRKIHSIGETPCLVITGGINANYEDKNSELGKMISASIPKPFEEEYLKRIISKFIPKHSSNKAS